MLCPCYFTVISYSFSYNGIQFHLHINFVFVLMYILAVFFCLFSCLFRICVCVVHGFAGPEEPKEKMSHWAIFFKTFPYVWPQNSFKLKIYFILSLFFLLSGSLSDLVLPVAFKYVIDELVHQPPYFPWLPIVIYGGVRFTGTFFQQLRDIVFSEVAANTERQVALETFQHLQSLSLSFHLKRETGSVLRSISRGSTSFAQVLRLVSFQIVPIFIQVAIVCVYLYLQFEWYFSALTGSIIIFYFIFTLTTTNWRDRIRRIMNEKENEYNQKALDALLNFETVKYFNAELHETKRYDTSLIAYTKANVNVNQSLALLNTGIMKIHCKSC